MEFIVDEEMMLGVQGCLDKVRDLIDDDTILHVEKDIQFDNNKDATGTADIILFNVRTGVLRVIDFKYGKRTVGAENNNQLLCYAVGARRMIEGTGASAKEMVNSIVPAVYQPRCIGEQAYKEAVPLSRKELLAWEKKILTPAIRATTHKKPKFKAGDHCSFCPGLVACPEVEAETKDVVEVTNINVPARSDKALMKIYLKKDLIRKLLYAIEEEVKTRLMRGGEIEGVKLVKGKGGHRRWAAGVEEKVAAAHGEDAYEPAKLKSPAQIENLPEGKKTTDGLTVRTEGAPSLAMADDPRPAISRKALDVFGNFIQN